MRVIAVLSVLCLVVPLLTFANGESNAEEYLEPSEIAALNSMWKDVNFTELELASKAYHPHTKLGVPDIVQLYEYNFETHYVETSDGYILGLHRITGNSSNPNPKGKQVVLLQHGIFSNSAVWVITGPERGLAFILADAGYDVWLGNTRGNLYSRQHKNITTDDPEYWYYSWHELGTNDLTAMIDHILKETEREKLFYIGHSQGTTIFYTMATEKPEYNDKIQAAFHFAPVAYSSRMSNPIAQILSQRIDQISLIFKLLGIYEFNPTELFYDLFTPSSCETICKNIQFLMFGFNKDQMDLKLLPVVMAQQESSGIAVNQLVHYGQIVKSGFFRQLDLGLLGNLVKYHSLTPLNYKLKNITAPVALHYGLADTLVDSEDVAELYSQLPNPIGKFKVPLDSFSHADFIVATDVKTLVYDKVLSLMSQYGD